MINPAAVRAVNHDQLAGLQLADAVATSAYYAVANNVYGDTEDRYLRLLAPTIYRQGKNNINGYGLKFWCDDQETVQRVLAALTAT